MVTERQPVSLLICDDHGILADALAGFLDGEPTLRLVHPPVATGEEAVAVCGEARPDVVLMDIELAGDVDGLEATRRILDVSPETKVVILSGRSRRDTLLDAVEAGACGYLTKAEAAEDVVAVVLAAARGETLFDPAMMADLRPDGAGHNAAGGKVEDRLSSLTAGERDVLRLLAAGKRTDAIAAELVISPGTVETHVQHILAKLGVRSRLEAVALTAAGPHT
jgi:DNA-binding NarL/FixJ family response regulator